jgi:antitoxin CcdA
MVPTLSCGPCMRMIDAHQMPSFASMPDKAEERPVLYGARKSANLSVNAALLEEAKALGINLSRAFEQHLAELVRRRKEAAWQSENRAGVEAYNRFVENKGVFGDKWRKF